ncbi:MAG: copper resistance protein NlpE [Burkholderiaceae bacterium]|nr:copper resistance protein NlpE [Burkholderiaceae bacterium]MDP5110982.1 copper resistance protein NlpE [Burkholderiaceae bacterium]
MQTSSLLRLYLIGNAIMSGHTAGHSTLRTALCRSLALCLPVLVVGCTQMQQQMQQPGYYNPPAASSATDAIEHAESPTGSQTIRAPSQIQIGFKGRASDAAPVPGQTGASSSQGATAVAETRSLQASLFPEPLTFAGTLPCFHPEMKCSAQRITLTIAPNGRWRARAAYLEQANTSGTPLADQGCWRVFPQTVPRVILLNPAGNVRAELALTSSNVLRLVSINGDSTNLTYTLTRQPDLDPIDELSKNAAPNCP